MVRIKVIDEEEATGALQALYQRIGNQRGGVAEVLKIHSLLPETLEDHFNLYYTLLFKLRKTGLGRVLLESIAVVVSATNQCDYCVAHHSQPLLRLMKDQDLVNAVRVLDWSFLEDHLEDKTLVVLQLAHKITLEPYAVTDQDIEGLKKLGYSDEQILQIVLIANYFNFVNRNVLALGVTLESDFEKTTN
ncbi:MAG: peroxidase-related enzyme [Fidelibacterota bacterium]